MSGTKCINLENEMEEREKDLNKVVFSFDIDIDFDRINWIRFPFFHSAFFTLNFVSWIHSYIPSNLK